jgi:hypothetical protein
MLLTEAIGRGYRGVFSHRLLISANAVREGITPDLAYLLDPEARKEWHELYHGGEDRSSHLCGGWYDPDVVLYDQHLRAAI